MSYSNLFYCLESNNINNNINNNQISFENLFPLKQKMYKIVIKKNIENIDDIMDIINKYPILKNVEYNIDLKLLHKIKEPLKKLQSMIGMNVIKNNIIEQILYYLQGLHNNNDYLHTVIYGPPGTGKTEISKIIGEIFMNMGILKNKIFKKEMLSNSVLEVCYLSMKFTLLGIIIKRIVFQKNV